MAKNNAKYAPLAQIDGRPQKMTAADIQAQPWQLALQRKPVTTWVTCLVLILCFISATIFSFDSSINFSAEEHPGMLPGSSPSTQELAPPPPPDATRLIDFLVGGCNIWKGDWISHPEGPAYTNATCPYIQPNQDCIKNGRPDLGFLYWRWKPHDCELPLFDPRAFLELVQGKKWIFIGDSLARNNYQSVLCSLAQVERPECTYNDGFDGNVHWLFKSYNFTLAVAWAPFFVRGTEEEAEGFAKGIAKVYLDMVDESWGPWVQNYDYIVVGGGRWYQRVSLYFKQKEVMGCNWCGAIAANVTDVGFGYAYGAALRTVLDFLIKSEYKGVVFLRTFSPEHWQNGAWDEGGNCTQKSPLDSKATALDGLSKLMYKIQLQEMGKTLQRRSEYSFTLKIVDTLHAALLRPDAHPGPYGHFHPRVQNDCVHWCLPGAVDTWTAMLLQVLKHL